MPEGPTILMLREQADRFSGKVVRRAAGTAKIDIARLENKRVKAVRTWGKHLLLQFAGFSVRVHLLLFGSYRIDDPKDVVPRLSMTFDNGQLDFYASDVRFIEGDLDEAYDWTADVLSESWSPASARKKLRANPGLLVCDALLDQDIFAGVGNIIKNEVLFRCKLSPESVVGAIPAAKLSAMVNEAHAFSVQFLEWRRAGVLKKNCQVHNKSMCPRCGIELTVRELGKTHRRAFYCDQCQVRFGGAGVEPPARARARAGARSAGKAAATKRSPRPRQ